MKTTVSTVLALVCVTGWVTAADKSGAADNVSVEDIILGKLMRPIHPHFGAANWDILDYPQAPGGPLKLANPRKPGEFIEVDVDFAGKVVVLVEIDGEETGRWSSKDGMPQALKAYRKVCDEYAPRGVVFLAVLSNGSGTTAEQSQSLLAGAAQYMDKHDVPGHVVVDAPGKPGSRQSEFYNYVQAHVPGHPPRSLVCIRNTDGKIVYRGVEKEIGFGYHTIRHILDRLLDPDYDATIRREFYPEKSRSLPIVENREDGLVYRDDFEGYGNSHQFKLEPRWGFSYSRQSRLDRRPSIVAGLGRNASCAVSVDRHVPAPCLVPYGLQHQFPAALSNGEVTFFIRRTEKDVKEKPYYKERDRDINPRRSLCIQFGRPGSYEPSGFLLASGDWKEETFVMTFRMDRPGSVRFSENNWHKVTVHCKPGDKAKLLVDGREIGRLNSEAIDWIGFRMDEPDKAFYVDDVGILYRGDAQQIASQHEKMRPDDVQPVEPFTEAEIKAIEQPFKPQRFGVERVKLPSGCISRADHGGYKHPYLSFDHPVPVDDLVLEDLRNPGNLLNVLEKYKGRVILVTKVRKGDHNTERNLRSRTVNRSHTVFHRSYVLAKEYQQKGAVIIGVTGDDGGHREITTSYEDRVRTVFEGKVVSKAIAAELNIPYEYVTYGGFPEVYGELLAERFPNQMRLWNKSLNTQRGNLFRGSFAGWGPDTVVDGNGDVVFRGSDLDGITYFQTRYALDRLLDEVFDSAARQEFRNPHLPHYKSPLLPKVEKRADPVAPGTGGLAYLDDFESYEAGYSGTYGFRLHSRWGFKYAYERGHFVRGAHIKARNGRHNTKAMLLTAMAEADVLHGNCYRSKVRHEFPALLENGYVSLQVRRGMHTSDGWSCGKPGVFRFAVVLRDAEGKINQFFTTFGDWQQEKFALANMPNEMAKELKKADDELYGPPGTWAGRWPGFCEDTGIAMGENTWHEMRLSCRTGQKVTVFVDGKEATTLNCEALSHLELWGEVYSGTWIDDVELFYEGNAETLKKEHAEAMEQNLIRRQAEWKQEAEAWEAKIGK